MKLRWMFLLVGLAVPVLLSGVAAPAAVDAQGNRPNNCPQLVRTAEEELVLNCANLPFDTACYGYNDVQARLEDDPEHAIDEDFVPGTWTRLSEYASVSAGAMNVSEGVWGQAMLNVQADIPRGLAEELPADPGVRFLLFGETEVESAVPFDRLFIPVDEPLALTPGANSDVREAPDAASELLGTVMAGTTVYADGVSPDGQWVRVAYQMAAGWIALADVPGADVSGLPTIAEDSLSPMQVFYLRTGSSALQCNQAVPAMLFMQVPEGVTANLEVDGVDFRLDSATVVARILNGTDADPNNDTLLFQVISGILTIYPDTASEIIVPAGFNYPTCQLDSPALLDGWDGVGNDQIADCAGGLPVPFSNQGRQEIQSLEGMSDNLFFYNFRIPRVTRASGVGGPIDKIEIPPDSPAYDRIIRNCDLGRIPPEVCQHLTGYTP